MKTVGLYARVRHAVLIEGISGRAAADRFGINARTVSKMLKFSVPPGYVRKKPPFRPKLDEFTGVIDGILATDKDRPKKQRHTSKRIFERLRAEHGFTGKITIVKDYVAEDALVGRGDLVDADDAEVADIVRRVKTRRGRIDALQQRQPPSSLPSSSRRGSGGALIKVDATRVATERYREAGPVHVGYQFWQRLELDPILREVGLSATVRRLACAMVLNRLIAPASEHAMPAWMRRTALADLLGTNFDNVAEDPLYEVLDKLHPHRATIEAALVERERSLFNLDATIYLYDLTSTYFEGQCLRNPKAKRGYSRDHRPDCKQVVVALVINRDGFAITHEVFAGNTQDRTTLATMLDLLAERAGLKEGATVVVDRGMAFDENIAEIKRRKLHYVVASRQPERDRFLADFEDVDGFVPVLRQPSPLNESQKKSKIEVQTRRDGEQTYVLCRSEQRIAKDRAIRAKQEGRLRADIDSLAKRVAQRKLVKPAKINQAIGRLKERYPRVARYFDLSYAPHTATLAAPFNADKHAKAEQLDGCYLLKTDRTDLSGNELLRIYLLLTRAENAFRDMKSPLAERPIFHHTERRTESHIFLCVLATRKFCSDNRGRLCLTPSGR
jgi:hypothetical protein